MVGKEEIERMVEEGAYEEALRALDGNVGAEPANDLWYLMRGQLLWRLGENAKAMSDFAHAVQINPDSPAKAALDLTRSVMDFYNPDMLNP